MIRRQANTGPGGAAAASMSSLLVGPAGYSLNGGDGAESSEQAKMPSRGRNGRKPRLTTDDKRFHSTNKRNESRGSKERIDEQRQDTAKSSWPPSWLTGRLGYLI